MKINKIISIVLLVSMMVNIFITYAGTGSEGESDISGGLYYPNYAPSGGYKFTVYNGDGSQLDPPVSKIVLPRPETGIPRTLQVKACNGKYPFDARTIDMSSVTVVSGCEIVWVDYETCPGIYEEGLITTLKITKNANDYAEWAQEGDNLSSKFLTVMNEIGATSQVGGDFQTWITTTTNENGERPYVTCEPVGFIMPKSAYYPEGSPDKVGVVEKKSDGSAYKNTKYSSMTWKLETYLEMRNDSEVYYPSVLKDVIKVPIAGGVEGLQKAKARMGATGFVNEGGYFMGVGLTSGWYPASSSGANREIKAIMF